MDYEIREWDDFGYANAPRFKEPCPGAIQKGKSRGPRRDALTGRFWLASLELTGDGVGSGFFTLFRVLVFYLF